MRCPIPGLKPKVLNMILFNSGWEHGKVKHQVFYRNGVFLKYMSTFTRVFWRNNRWSYKINDAFFFYNKKNQASQVVSLCRLRLRQFASGFMVEKDPQVILMTSWELDLYLLKHKGGLLHQKKFWWHQKRCWNDLHLKMYVYICIYM